MTPYSLPARNRTVVTLDLTLITAISWIYFWRLARGPSQCAWST
jgi:hypothetical protein